MILILFFALVLNIVAIGLTYYCLDYMSKKEKVVFIAVGIAVIYILTSFVYWISTKDIQIKAVSEKTKDIVTFLFVPINSILVLPLFAKSYMKNKIGKLKSDKFRNRCVVLGIILLIIFIFECSYFKDIQNGVISIMNNLQEKSVVNEENTQLNTNVQTNMLIDENILTNQIENNMNVNNISN